MIFVLYVLIGCLCYWVAKNEFNMTGQRLWGSALIVPVVLAILLNVFHYRMFIFLIIIGLVVYVLRDELAASNGRSNWKNIDASITSPYEFVDHLKQKISDSAENSEIEVMPESLPYNRVQAFIQETELPIDSSAVFPIIYDAQPADNEMAFLEYGYTVLTSGIVIKYQVVDKSDETKSKKKQYKVATEVVLFQDLYFVLRKGNRLVLWYDQKGKQKVTLATEEMAIRLEQLITMVIQLGWTHNVQGVLKQYTDEDEHGLDAIIEKADQSAERIVALKEVADQAKVAYSHDQSVRNATNFRAGAVDLNQTLSDELIINQVADRFGKGQGHGHAGEQAGHVNDALKFRKAERLGGTHEKGGADRVVNGQLIQTKYYTTARGSVEGYMAKGYASRGMILECPKDQYNQAVKIISQKIKQGKIPGETNPNNAAKYVKRGALTYEQSVVATKSIFDRHSTIKVRENGKVVKDSNGIDQVREVTFGEKLKYSVGTDVKTGAVAALPVATVTAVWTFTVAMWSGAEVKDALKMSMLGFLKPMVFGIGIYTFSSQYVGSKMGEALATTFFGEGGSKELAKVGQFAGGTVVAIISYGPDTIDFLRGRISVNQLVKNVTVSTTGIVVGSVLGSTLGPIGTVVGGALGSFTSKKVFDHFSEDDSLKMIRIAKEEFIDIVISMPLSAEEFQDITTKIFLDKKSVGLYKEMYASGTARKYIDDILRELMIDKFKKREIPEDDIINMVQNEQDMFTVSA